MLEQIALVTGATAGIGASVARGLAGAGATVLMVGRDAAKLERAVAATRAASGNPRVEGLLADLASLAEVARLADEVRVRYGRLSVLVNNAGVVTRERRLSHDGLELQLAVNHLAPFLLTNLLMPKLLARPGARIVNVASHAHRFAWFDLDDLHSRKRYSSMRVYGGSKLANILFTNELASRIGSRDLRVWSVHPGAVATRLGANNGGIAKIVLPLLALFFKTPDQGAETSIHLCADAGVRAANGTYFADCKPVALTGRAADPELARRLWRESEKLVGLDGGSEAIWR